MYPIRVFFILFNYRKNGSLRVFHDTNLYLLMLKKQAEVLQISSITKN